MSQQENMPGVTAAESGIVDAGTRHELASAASKILLRGRRVGVLAPGADPFQEEGRLMERRYQISRAAVGIDGGVLVGTVGRYRSDSSYQCTLESIVLGPNRDLLGNREWVVFEAQLGERKPRSSTDRWSAFGHSLVEQKVGWYADWNQTALEEDEASSLDDRVGRIAGSFNDARVPAREMLPEASRFFVRTVASR